VVEQGQHVVANDLFKREKMLVNTVFSSFCLTLAGLKRSLGTYNAGFAGELERCHIVWLIREEVLML
jgi:hypothetical protein